MDVFCHLFLSVTVQYWCSNF